MRASPLLAVGLLSGLLTGTLLGGCSPKRTAASQRSQSDADSARRVSNQNDAFADGRGKDVPDDGQPGKDDAGDADTGGKGNPAVDDGKGDDSGATDDDDDPIKGDGGNDDGPNQNDPHQHEPEPPAPPPPPPPHKEGCFIWVLRNRDHGCGPNRYHAWKLWIQATPPEMVASGTGVSPGASAGTPLAEGNYGRNDHGPGCTQPVPMPLTYTHKGQVYNLWTEGVAGSEDCQVYTAAVSPLILSFVDEQVKMLGPNKGPLFDLTGDNVRERFSWPQDASKHLFLACDKNGNGRIEDASELFGNATVGAGGQRAANGFDALRQHDANKDGMLDAKDPQFAALRLWGDANHNGVTDAGELFTLAQKNVKSLKLTYTVKPVRLDFYGNESRETSTFTLSDGRTLPVKDYWLIPGAAD